MITNAVDDQRDWNLSPRTVGTRFGRKQKLGIQSPDLEIQIPSEGDPSDVGQKQYPGNRINLPESNRRRHDSAPHEDDINEGEARLMQSKEQPRPYRVEKQLKAE